MEPLNYKINLDKTLPGKTVFLSRALFYSVLALVVGSVLWMTLTHVDVVVDARGKMMIQGEPLKLSVAESGIVAEAPVQVGDHVAAGQLLLRLDSFHYDATEAKLAADLDGAKADAARFATTARTLREVEPNLTEEARVGRSTIDVLTRQIAAAGANGEGSDVPRKQLDLEAARASLARAQAALARNSGDIAEAQQQAIANEAKARSLAAQLNEAREARKRLTLTAPAAGTISQLSALHPGAAASVGEPAVVLMPDSLPLLAALRIPNASMRRLLPGDPVRLRLDAFPSEDFGDIPGRLLTIDPDADSQGMYRAWVIPQRVEFQGPVGPEKLRAGLELSAKILIERRSILSILLKPLHRLTQPVSVGQ